MTQADSKPVPTQSAIFTQGSTMRHVVVMTVTAAIGLIAIFFVDAISLYYIAQLNDPAQTSAVGRASYLIAFLIGISVGMMIGTLVIVARNIGAGEREIARRFSGSAIVGIFVVGLLFTLLAVFLVNPMLDILNAQGESRTYAQHYLIIMLPGMPFMMAGMTAMGILRSVGDARRAMYVTLLGGIMVAILDPIFIFVLDLQITGAAIVSLIVRITFAATGLWFLIRNHNMLKFSPPRQIVADMAGIGSFAVPAVFTNMAAPVGTFLIASKIAEFGDGAIAGQAIVDRLVPLAFGVIFALSGAVGPIIGQNIGARLPARARQTLVDGLIFNLVYVIAMWLILFLVQDQIVAAYNLSGNAELMVRLFTIWIAGSFLFNGMLFVTNAAFNNLGKPFWATAFNWSRQTIGVIPFILVGAALGGLPGIAIGVFVGSIPFALLAVYAAFRLLNSISRNSADHAEQSPSQATAI